MRFYSKPRLIISIIIGIAISVASAIVIYRDQIKDADSKEKIEIAKAYVEKVIGEKGEDRFLSYGKAYEAVGEIRSIIRLSGYNEIIAVSKININLPEGNMRAGIVESSKKAYKTTGEVTTKAILIGIFSPILTIPFSLLIIFLVIFIPTLLWHFILDRINELSKSIQGKR